jgi:collagen type VII alpha
MSTTPVLSANFSGLTSEINRVFSVMSGKTPVLNGPSGATGPVGATGPRGITGPTGPMGIGIGTTLKGAWSAASTYGLNSGSPDAVTYNGAFYVCLNNSVSGSITPDQDTTNWLRYVQQGGTGPTGPLGVTGATGINGVTGPTGPIGIGIGTSLKGTWVAGQTYTTNSGTSPDAVTYNGSLYICLNTVQSATSPDQDPTNWLRYVQQGGTGPTGPLGATGATGVMGPTGIKGDIGFTGPTGPTGLKGDTGTTGATGSISSVGSDGQLLYNRGGVLAATGSMVFRSTGPTGPLGQATGPIGQPTLQLGAYILPTINATYDLGATGIQFKDVHFSGSLYNNGQPFSGGGGGGITAPTDNFMVAGGTGTNRLAYSYDGITWTGSTSGNSIITGTPGVVAWNGSLWVAGGSGTNRLAYSSDGITWTVSANGNFIFETACTALAWNGSIWVAGGSGTNQLAYSSDGISWTASTSGNSIFTTECNAVAWNGSLWVAGGSGANRLVYSSDGITWTASTSGNFIFEAACTAVAWNGSLWVAGSTGFNKLAYSSDGITWNVSANGSSIITTSCNEVGWNGSLWVAGGSGTNQLAYSSDGITWTASANGNSIFTTECNAVAWNGSLWVAGGTGTNKLAYSSDGITWTPSTSGNTIISTACSAVASRRPLPFVGSGGSTPGLYYRASGPTGPTGPWLQLSANIVPTTNAIYDLGATGLQVKNIYFSGDLYQNGTVFSGVAGTDGQFTYNNAGTSAGSNKLVYRPTGPTGPTGQPTGPTGPTLQIGAHIVPNADLAYDLGATGLRFRDIHVGGSTIYLGDSVSINANNEGSLSVTNNSGTVNLVTPSGFNGGILSGTGVISTEFASEFFQIETFNPPFAEAPIVVASIAGAGYTADRVYILNTEVLTGQCRIYGTALNIPYNWIATARTNYPPEPPL